MAMLSLLLLLTSALLRTAQPDRQLPRPNAGCDHLGGALLLGLLHRLGGQARWRRACTMKRLQDPKRAATANLFKCAEVAGRIVGAAPTRWLLTNSGRFRVALPSITSCILNWHGTTRVPQHVCKTKL